MHTKTNYKKHNFTDTSYQISKKNWDKLNNIIKIKYCSQYKWNNSCHLLNVGVIKQNK